MAQSVNRVWADLSSHLVLLPWEETAQMIYGQFSNSVRLNGWAFGVCGSGAHGLDRLTSSSDVRNPGRNEADTISEDPHGTQALTCLDEEQTPTLSRVKIFDQPFTRRCRHIIAF